MRKNNLTVTILVFLLFTTAGLFVEYKKSSNKIYYQNLQAYQDSLKVWENSYGKLVAEKKTILLKKNDLEKIIEKIDEEKLGMKKQLKKFKGEKTVVITKTETKIDTLKIIIDANGKFNRTNEHYSIVGTVADSIKFDTIKIFNTQGIIFGNKSQGFFKPNLITAQITNSNPYVVTTNVQSFTTYIPPKNWGVGLQAGVGVSSNLQPIFYLGFGINFGKSIF